MPGGPVVQVGSGEVDGDHVAVVRRGGLGPGGPQGPVVRVERRAGHGGVRRLGDRVAADAGLELAEQHRAAAAVAGVVDGYGALDGGRSTGRPSSGCRSALSVGLGSPVGSDVWLLDGLATGSARCRRRSSCATTAIATITAAVATAPTA